MARARRNKEGVTHMVETITISKKTVQAVIDALSTVETRGAGNLNALLACIQVLQKAVNQPQEGVKQA